MALIQLVIAWPVYDLLARNPEFFVARQARPDDIGFLVFALSVALPLLLAGLQALVFRMNSKIGGTLYTLIIFLLFFLLGHLIANRFGPSAYVTTWATVLSLALLFIYMRMQPGKMFISFLIPAIVIVPVLFLLNTEIRPLLLPKKAGNSQSQVSAGNLSPVLFIVFDEFPSNVYWVPTDSLTPAGFQISVLFQWMPIGFPTQPRWLPVLSLLSRQYSPAVTPIPIVCRTMENTRTTCSHGWVTITISMLMKRYLRCAQPACAVAGVCLRPVADGSQ